MTEGRAVEWISDFDQHARGLRDEDRRLLFNSFFDSISALFESWPVCLPVMREWALGDALPC